MKPFEFVFVIISIVIGLAFTEFANIVGFMVKNYKVSNFSLPYLLIMLVGGVGGLNYWLSNYYSKKIVQWDNLKVGLLFLTSLIYYTTARVYSPDFNSFNHDYNQLYHEVIGSSLVLLICWVISITYESYYLKKGRPLKWYIFMLAFVLLAGSGILIENRVYRESVAYIMFILQAFNLAANRTVITEDEK